MDKLQKQKDKLERLMDQRIALVKEIDKINDVRYELDATINKLTEDIERRTAKLEKRPMGYFAFYRGKFGILTWVNESGCEMGFEGAPERVEKLSWCRYD